MLSRRNFRGPWAGLPIAWTDEDRFDEAVYRSDIARCAKAGIPGIYTGGTTGEFYAIDLDEFRLITSVTIEEARSNNVPVMIGCTSTCTRNVLRRIEVAVAKGADAVQVALPFWMPLADHEILPFFKEVTAASAPMALSIYETNRAKRVLTLDQHRAIRDAAPTYMMVKAVEGTLGDTVEGCRQLSEFTNVFSDEPRWAELGQADVAGSCSSMVYWNPRVLLSLWDAVQRGQWEIVSAQCDRLAMLLRHLFTSFEGRGFADSAYDRLGARATGFLQTSLRCRQPYSHATPQDLRALRDWLHVELPEMLKLPEHL